MGEKLSHSYSPQIHALLADYEYKLYECPPQQLDAFMKTTTLDGFNVTIPYKKAVMPYCAELSDAARAIGSVNTVVRRADGTFYGDNTDAFGFESLICANGVTVAGKKAVVFGSGGASRTVCAVLESLGAASVRVLSRGGKESYGDLAPYADVELIVNATPAGMYPNNGSAAADLSAFPSCESVLDLVYNPARTKLLLQAEQRALRCAGGLHMLVAQAKRSAEIFTGAHIADTEIARICTLLQNEMRNIVLIGMPGSGKSTLARLLAERLGREWADCDEYIERMAGASCAEIIESRGEEHFRELETQALSQLGKRSALVIATGGGCVTRTENYPLLHQNGVIIRIDRALKKLPTDDRPLSRGDLGALYAARDSLYDRFADVTVDNNTSLESAVSRLVEVSEGR